MNGYRFFSWPVLVLGISSWLQVDGLRAQELLDVPPDPPAGAVLSQDVLAEEAASPEPEALLSGPLHEAFAEPIQVDAEPSIVIAQQPPEPIEELVPEIRPEEDGAIWLPGYWAWEPEREDFIWVSGVWRVPPPDREWVPGYWAEVDGGHQWIAGFWAPIERREVEYLPPPPESLESGPSSPQPGDEYTWVPGCWNYHQSHYVWRPGYWSPYYSNWVWVPEHYVWTPRGVVFVNGYWDYSLTGRGYLFSPVYVPSDYYAHQTYYYRPRVLVNVSRILLHLFVYPRHRHYYYGDYYAPYYRDRGFYSWTDYHRRSYDPLLSYYQWYHRGRGVDYIDRLNRWNSYYTRNEAYRPPRTYQALARMIDEGDREHAEMHRSLARDVRQLMDDPDAARQFRRVSRDQQQQIARIASERRELKRERERTERRERGEGAELTQARAEPNTRVEPTGRLNLPENSEYRELVRNNRREAPPVPGADNRGARDRRSADARRDQDRDDPRRSTARRGDRTGDNVEGGTPEIERGARELDRALTETDPESDADRANRDRDRDRDRSQRRRPQDAAGIDAEQLVPRTTERGDAARRNAQSIEGERRVNRREVDRPNARDLERPDADRPERLDQDRLDAERRSAERRNAERVNRERRDVERLNAERLDAERRSAQRRNIERQTAERLEAARRDAERRSAERINERMNAERLNNEALRRNAELRNNIERPRRAIDVPERSIPQNVPRDFDRPRMDRPNREIRERPSFDAPRERRGGGNGGGRGRGFNLGASEGAQPEVTRPRVTVDVPERGMPVNIDRPQRERAERPDRGEQRARAEDRGRGEDRGEDRGRGDERRGNGNRGRDD